MSPRVCIVQCIKDNLELFVPGDIELRVFDIRVMGFDLDCWIELAS
jgi:hypothetical protein